MDDDSAHPTPLSSPGLQRRSLKLLPLKLARTYFIGAVLWIFISDFCLATFVTHPAVRLYLQSIKGLFFVSTSAAMLYWLLRRSLRTLQQTERMMRESEERLRLILQHMPVMLNAFDDQNTITVWNHECENVTGYSAAAMIGNPQAMTLLYPEATYRQQMIDTWAELGNHYRDWEWEVTCSDGSVKTVAWSNISDRFPIPGWMAWGIGVDVTDRKRSEEALRESEIRFRSLCDSSPIGIYLTRSDGYTTYTNPRCQEIFGSTALDLIGHGWTERLHPDDYERVIQTWSAARADGQPFTTDYRVIPPAHSIRWVEDRAAPMRSDEGELMGYVGTVEDITDRKQAEQQIRLLNQTLEQQNLELEALVEQRTAELMTFINTLPDYIFVVERDTMRTLFCNDRNAWLGDYESYRQMAGKTIFECYAPDLAATFAEQNQQVFASGETIHFQETYTTPLGTFHFDTYKIPLKKPNGDVYALIGTSRDITELVEARQKLTDRTTQLERVNQELESFSYSVSHDLRAPLRHINGFVTLLTQQLEQNGQLTDPTVTHYLQTIQNSSQTMRQLIDGLLTLSQVGRRQIAQVPVDLHQLVTTVLAQLPGGASHTTAETANHEQAVQFCVGDLPTVIGDATLLKQVFANLIDNAVKFSRVRETSVKQNHDPAPVEIGSLDDGTVFVRDHGVGFQMAYADQLFGAFQRLHSRSEFEGTGIGLAIVQRIIHRHGGDIWAESQPGQGATFYFKLGERSSGTSKATGG